MFVARGLTTAQAHLAYPLVSCRYPTLSLPLWTNYVRAAEDGNARERLVSLVDQRDRPHAIFAWFVDRPPAVARLRIAHIATFQLIGDAIHRALHCTLDALAAEHACREVIVETWTGCDDVANVHSTGASAAPGRVLTLGSTVARTGALN